MRNLAILGLAVFALTRAAAPVNAQQSLAEIANKEKERRETITAPAKIYTNDDLVLSSQPPGVERLVPPATPPVLAGSSLPDPRYPFPPIPAECSRTEQATEPSQSFRETFKCPDGTTHIKWTNERDGTTWRQAYRPDGSQYGVNSCGVRWVVYAGRERIYVNSRGERRDGTGVERAIADADLECSKNYQRPQQTEAARQAPPQTTVIILERPLSQYGYPTPPPPVEPPPPVKPPPAAVPGGTIIPCQTPPSGDPKRDAQVAALCREGPAR